MSSSQLVHSRTEGKLDVWKRAADFLTFLRVIISFLIALYAKLAREFDPLIMSLMVISGWGTDLFDGQFARRSKTRTDTWVGRHDGEIDLFFAFSIWFALYILGRISIEVFFSFPFLVGVAKAILKTKAVFQIGMAGSYGAFIFKVASQKRAALETVIAWIVLTVLVDPKKAKKEVTGFLKEISSIFEK